MANYFPQADPLGNCCDCSVRTDPCQDCVSNVLYIQFQITANNNLDVDDSLIIGKNDFSAGVTMARPNSGSGTERFQFGYFTPTGSHFVNDTSGSFPTGTLFTVDYKLDFSVSPAVATFRVNSSVIGSFLLDKGGLPINFFAVGAYQNTGFRQDYNMDNVKLGTTGFGSSDLFLADFTSSIVPPFDSTVGSDLSLSSGTLHVVHTAGHTASYAQKAFTFP